MDNIVRAIRYGAGDDKESLLTREWLVTNGLGGYASGTISGPEQGSEGSLIELTRNGAEPLDLPDGSTRTFLEDGDEVVLRGRAGELELGEVRGRVLPAVCGPGTAR